MTVRARNPVRTAYLALLACTLCSSALAGETRYVDGAATRPGDGTLDAPFQTIQAAIDWPATTSGDEVLVFPGVYLETIDFAGKSLRIESLSGRDSTVIDGAGLGSTVRADSGQEPPTAIIGFEIRGGSGTPHGFWGDPAGGGLFQVGGTVAVRSCRIVDNQDALLGGGVYVENGTLVLETSEVIENSGDNLDQLGGGIHALASTLVLEDCTVSKNEGSQFPTDKFGGGVYGEDSVLIVESCTFAENTANSGGALYLRDCTTSLARSSVTSNSAFVLGGGGVAIRGGTLTVDSCEFVANWAFEATGGAALCGDAAHLELVDSLLELNEAEYNAGAIEVQGSSTLAAFGVVFRANVAGIGDGGALWVGGSAVASLEKCILMSNRAPDPSYGGGVGGAVRGAAALDRCTLVDNSAGGSGGAVFDGSLTNSIVWANTPDALAGTASATYSNIDGGWPGRGNIDADPEFWPYQEEYFLRSGSPCVEAGDPSAPPDPDGSRADIGARPFDLARLPPPTPYCAGVDSLGCLGAITWSGHLDVTSLAPFHVAATGVPPGIVGFLAWAPEGRVLPFLGPGIGCIPTPYQRITPLFSGPGNGTACSGRFEVTLSAGFFLSRGVEYGEPVYLQFHYEDRLSPGEPRSSAAIVVGVGQTRPNLLK